jgi:hypothetical protein
LSNLRAHRPKGSIAIVRAERRQLTPLLSSVTRPVKVRFARGRA